MAKVALVTGGAKRIGRAVAERLARDGYHCLIHANNSYDEACEFAKSLTLAGSPSHAVQHHIQDPGAAACALLDASVSLFGCLPTTSVLSAASFDFDDPLSGGHVMGTEQMNLNFLFPIAYCSELARRVKRGHSHSVTLFTDYKIERLTNFILAQQACVGWCLAILECVLRRANSYQRHRSRPHSPGSWQHAGRAEQARA